MSFRLMPYVISLAGPFVLFAAIACGEAQSLSVNPVPLELSNEARYRVQVNGTSVPVLQVGLNVYAVSFDFTGKAEMQVDVEESDLNLEGFWKWRAIDEPPVHNADYFKGNAIVRPLSKKVLTVTNKNNAKFTLTEPGQYTLEAPGVSKYSDETLLIFANRPEVNPPTEHQAGVIYLGPGIHQTHITLQSNETLYLAPGAFLLGAVNVWNAEHVAIRGRGVVLYEEPLKFGVDNGPFNRPNQHALTTSNVKGLTVEGVTFVIRSQTWSIQLVKTSDVLFDNVKIVNVTRSNINGDGIDWMDGEHGVFRNSFIRSSDDSFAFLAASSLADFRPKDPTQVEHFGSIKDVLVTNCVFWNTFGSILRMGWTSQSLTTSNVVVKDSDIIHGRNLMVIGNPKRIGHAHHSGYTFEDLRFENPATFTQWESDPSATFDHFLFKNVSMPDRQAADPSIRPDIPGVQFEDIGKPK